MAGNSRKILFPLTFQCGDFGYYYSTRTSELTTAVLICRRTQLDMQDCRQLVKSRIEDRGSKPCEFSQTAPPHNPSHSVSNTTFFWFSP
ncbi:hypothetical protein [Gossypium barbadense]|uniref:Uncharacterized protein n=2 Tax=Gossypium barbadense TaxID=3634 RepID=A0A5J5NDT7_GOSBA|nr:hypothetical protein [Gossypium barbadense]